MLLDNLIYLAFLIGIISAVSLPLGALTTLFWTPGDRAIAWLMAFGGGALLSAVTIDLFAPAIHKELFLEVSLGAVIGSLFYLLLNKQLNEKGGFLRKTATTIQYFRTRQNRRGRQLAQSLNRLPFYSKLPEHDRKQVLQKVKTVHLKADSIIHHHGDIQNQFYIIHKGQVNLRDPNHDLKTFIELTTQDAFGRMAFFNSMPNATLAQAKTDVSLWTITRKDFNALLSETDNLAKILLDYYRNDTELRHYLQTRHSMSPEQSEEHIQFIIELIESQQRLPDTREPRNMLSQAIQRLQTTHRFGLFDNCNEIMQTTIAGKLKYRTLRAGQAIFSNRSVADQLYLLESGRVELIDPKVRNEQFESISPGDFFGVMAFVVGGKHATTAIADTDVSFWVLDKKDFLELLSQIDPLHTRLKSYLKTENVHQYLIQEQKLPESRAQKWTKQTIKHLLPGQLPSLTDFAPHLYHHKAAYMAIWLGILLDGIPESLMIGSHMTEGHMISMSLVAGLFLSNYPEALSSSASMREQGIPFRQVLLAWVFLMVMTGIGAAIGNIVLDGASASTFALIGGIAGGAMLTVIAETMLPEAYVKGGSVIGFITLIGFLTAIMFKAFDTAM
ncbi:cyclic nucleotide-binding domain-containing protein [Thiomicrorhabdus sp.]|uniref:cyclic nucleotide-binding domain-containing protein n=1 Tax=Thiomicrorhabdus sp. TaxID=2039724 RepID=UPI0035616802